MADNDPEILDGFDDDSDLLGWDDDFGLLGWDAGPPVPGGIDPFDGPLGGPVGERVYLVTAILYEDWGSQSQTLADAAAPAIANHPIAGFPFGNDISSALSVELRSSTVQFATRADDPVLPSGFFDGRVIDAGSLSLSLPLVPVGDAAIETTIGRVVIDNTDGAFDTVLDQNTAISQAIVIRGGRLDIWVADFVTVFNARITGIGMTETEVTLDLQDPVVYAQNLYPTTVYTGLGDSTGDVELMGVVKPIVIGHVWNMSPVLINATLLIYQAHDGAITAVTGVFDGGVALVFDANYADYDALAATSSIGPGEYGTSLADGMIRVGGTPSFALTAHVDGVAAAGTTCDSIATWLVGQIETEVGLVVDHASFDALPSWTAGWVWNDNFTFAEAISRFVGDAGYHWGADTDGTVRALQLQSPDAGEVSASYGPYDIVALQRTQLPQGYEGIHHRRLVRFGKNWTVQDDSLWPWRR